MRWPPRPAVVESGAVLLLGATFLGSTAAASSDGALALDATGWLLAIANILPLVLLRRAPLAVLLILNVAYPLWVSTGQPAHLLQSLPALVATAALGVTRRPLWWRAFALVTPINMVSWVALGPWDTDVLEIGYVAVMFVGVWGLAVALADRRARTTQLERQAAELQAAREELAHQAVVAERTRIARDLHDIVAHALGVITVQAGVGAHLFAREPERAADALRVIEDTGRAALGDMSDLLGGLRSTGDPPTLPQPGVAAIGALVEQLEAAGIPVTLRLEGAARALPAGLELSAYRIAQEALTNTVRHAPGARAEVTIRYRPDELVLEIVDAGGGPDPVPNPRGHGLQGMRERVALYGGTLQAAPCDGGFLVRASLPT